MLLRLNSEMINEAKIIQKCDCVNKVKDYFSVSIPLKVMYGCCLCYSDVWCDWGRRLLYLHHGLISGLISWCHTAESQCRVGCTNNRNLGEELGFFIEYKCPCIHLLKCLFTFCSNTVLGCWIYWENLCRLLSPLEKYLADWVWRADPDSRGWLG